jgi:hypothetical protein
MTKHTQLTEDLIQALPGLMNGRLHFFANSMRFSLQQEMDNLLHLCLETKPNLNI